MLGTTAVVLGMVVPMVTLSGESVVHAANGNSDCAAPATTALTSLCVESSAYGSTTPPYDTTVAMGDRINDFKWLINEDTSTGDPALTPGNVANCLPARAAVTAQVAASNPALAIYQTAGSGNLKDCAWPSVHASAGHSTVIASGDQSDTGRLTNLPDGKYLISVTASGFKIDGVHFQVTGHVVASVNEEPGADFIVRMNPLPKKTATVRIHVFNDNASTNGQWDGQTETLVTCDVATPQQIAQNCGGSTDPLLVADPSTDLSGFSVAITDVLGMIVTTDVYGNPLCTQYETDGSGNVLLNDDGTPNPLTFANGGSSGSNLAGTDSTCLSDHYGDIVIPNMGPNRYAATVIPPDPRTHNGDKWIETTTLEGGHDWDSWNIEGGNGYDTELIVGGERVPPVTFGFVKLTHPDQVWNDAEAAGRNSAAENAYYDASAGFAGGPAGHGVLTGTVAIGRAYIGSGGASPLAGTNITNAKEDGVIKDGIVSISCLATCIAPTDTTVWTGRARTDGTFSVTGLQTGDYSVAFWDETQSYIMAILQYSVVGDPTQAQAPAVTSAIRSGTAINRVYTLNFSAPVNLPINTVLTLTGGNANWSGTFRVLAVNSTTSVRVVKTGGGGNPTGNATVLPQVFFGPMINPAPTDVGHVLLPGWFTDLTGVVFNDLNGDGIRQGNEPGIPDFVLTERTRGNSLQDQGAAVAVTNDAGEYDLSQGYPLGQFLIAEAYNPRYKNTGFTYTTDNDPTPHTVNSAQVDVDFLPVIGLSAKLDWGVQSYGTGTDYWSGDPNTAAPANENGGIVGTVTYDVTRNEFDPAFSAQEDYQPGVSGISMQLWKTHKNPDGTFVKTDTGAVQQYGVGDCTRDDSLRGTNAVVDGQVCKPFDYYVTESWTRPTGCTALDVNGNELAGEMALPDHLAKANVDYTHTDPNQPDCIEAPMSGFQIGGEGTVDGNYALTSLMRTSSLATAPAGGSALEDFYADAQNNPDVSDPLTSGDYVVEAVNPVDTVNAKATDDPTIGGYVPAGGGAPQRLYRFTDEKSINVMSGDTYVPQDGFAASHGAAGPDYSLAGASPKIRQDLNSLGAGTVAKCAGESQTLPDNTEAGLGAINPDLNAAGGNPYAGQDVPVCDAKLVTVAGGRSMNPGFFMYTDVPIPSKFYGLVNDDLNVQTDRRSIMLGEVAPASNVPVGVYDENGNWKVTAHSDVNGFYEILLPSMDTYNCPLPAGPCPNVYRLVGNDPGTLAHRNTDYNPQFRTIATEFQAWTGVVHPVDQAPTHNGITIEGPAAQFGALSLCKLAGDNPAMYSIDRPFYDPGDGGHVYTIKGTGLGTSGSLRMDGTSIATTGWSDTQITFAGSAVASLSQAPHQMSIVNGQSGLATVNGLTFHRLSPTGSGNSTYLRRTDVYEVSPTPVNDNAGARTFTPQNDAWDTITDTPAGFSGTSKTGQSVSSGRAIQRAVEAARQSAGGGNNARPKLVVIYPNTAPNYAAHNAFAAYFENVVLHSRVMLQGVGPGGATSPNNVVPGSNIDASQFWSATQVVPPGGNQDTADGSYSDDWRTFTAALPRTGTGPAEIPEGEGVLAIAESQTQWGGTNAPSVAFRPGVDGLLLTGGDQQGNPGNINTAPGAIGDTTTAPTNPGPAQGGAVMADQFIRDFNITNNQIQSNGGTYGTVRIGTPDLPGSTAAAQSNHNDRLNVANNRIVANGGTNLAGALGLFSGADNYSVAGNDFCGNFSAEYGGAISHYGFSNNGKIIRNRIYYNQGYDEGGGIMVAGALPANNNQLSPGAGAVTIDGNTLISNQSNDDGGGIRFLMAGNFPQLVENNIIANNLSTHEGGGVALDDAPNVTLVNNTIVKNITTATAATNGAVGDVRQANPAGVSTTGNSALLQITLPSGSPNWSRPKMLNNIFADNRAGWAELPTTVNFNQSAIHGIGDPADVVGTTPTPVQRWDVGVSSTAGLVPAPGSAAGFAATASQNTTNATSALTNSSGGYSFIGTDNIAPGIDGTVAAPAGVGFVNPQDFVVDSLMWRNNTNTSFPVIVAHMVPINLLADYHLQTTASTAFAVNAGSATGAGAIAPNHDIDGQGRPSGAFERGADELFVPNNVDLAISKTDGVTTVNQGAAVTYTVVVTNTGPNDATNAQVTDTIPAELQNATWTCATTAAATCGGASNGTGNVSRVVNVPVGASVTFTIQTAVRSNATGSVANTATVTKGAADSEPNTANNAATDTDTIHAFGGDLTITKSANKATVPRTGNAAARTVIYTATLKNSAGADTATGAVFNELGALGLSFTSWSCTATAGSSCGGAGGIGGPTNRSVTLAGAGTVTFTITATLTNPFFPFVQNLSVVNFVTLTPPAGFTDPTLTFGTNGASSTVTVTA